jgi:hypothetical protein
MAGGSSVLFGAAPGIHPGNVIHSESAVALMKSWGKHLIELA